MIALMGVLALAPWLLLGIARPRAALYAAAATSGIVSVSVDVGFNLVPSYLCVLTAAPAAILALRHIDLRRTDILILLFTVFYLLITVVTYGDAPLVANIGATGRNSVELRPVAQSLALLVMITTYFVARTLVVDRETLMGVLKWWRTGGLFVLAYAFYQTAAYRLDLPFQFVNSRRDGSLAPVADGIIRANSTLTEPTTLAQFLIILVAVDVSLKVLRGKRVRLGLPIVALVALTLTASRAGLLGLLVFGLTATLFAATSRPRKRGAKKPRRRPTDEHGLRRAATAVVLVLATISATPLGGLLQDRLLAIQGGSERYVRAGYWYAALDIFRDNPLGVGIGNYTFYYFSYLPPADSFQIVYEVTDAHNVLLDYLVEGGILTVSAYVLAISTLVVGAHGLAKDPRIPPDVQQAVILLVCALLAALAMQLTFSFFYLTYVWLLTGVIAACIAIDWQSEVSR